MGRDLEPVACCQDRLPEAVKSRRVESEDMLHNVLGQPIDQSTETKKNAEPAIFGLRSFYDPLHSSFR